MEKIIHGKMYEGNKCVGYHIFFGKMRRYAVVLNFEKKIFHWKCYRYSYFPKHKGFHLYFVVFGFSFVFSKSY